jgi:hypothetical protein
LETSKVRKVKDRKAGGYIIIADNEPARYTYRKAKEERMRQEKEFLAHRYIHPCFHKTEEEF